MNSTVIDFNTSHVSVRLLQIQHNQQTILYFNTSHVSVRSLKNSTEFATLALFQYISCVGSICLKRNQKLCRTHFNTSHVSVRFYSCLAKRSRHLNFNTSHVSVRCTISAIITVLQIISIHLMCRFDPLRYTVYRSPSFYFNTSHVSVRFCKHYISR